MPCSKLPEDLEACDKVGPQYKDKIGSVYGGNSHSTSVASPTHPGYFRLLHRIEFNFCLIICYTNIHGILTPRLPAFIILN